MGKRIALPRTFKPSHYKLSLRDLDFAAWTYKGTVTIDLEITQKTTEIVLNAEELQIIQSTLQDGNGDAPRTLQSGDCRYKKDDDTITISFDEELTVAKSYKLAIDFEGILNSQSTGFYRAQYKALDEPPASVARSENGLPYMVCTQFQPVGARRAFPCFDEPNMKATFSLDIELPADQTAISNTPVKDTEETRMGHKRVSFEETPAMSTYLFAWAAGDFKHIETSTVREYRGRTIPVRFYATAGLEQQGRYAIEEAAKAVDFFSETFGIDYPLAKMDILAIPEFAFGAMENWGLITGKDNLLVFDEKKSAESRKQMISTRVIHEVAHQWFGNLVTMDWWDELWLNEGFATWASHYAVDHHFHPEWNTWQRFMSQDMEGALIRDAMRSSHPIHTDIPDARNVHEVFDNISYQKSCAVLNMVANHMGVDKFLSGVASYLKQNMHRNATAEDLWRALDEVSGDDIVTKIRPWIQKIGHPVLIIEQNAGHLTLTQCRFLAVDNMKPEEDETIWWIPLGFQSLSDKERSPKTSALAERQQELSLTVAEALYLFNSSGTGFYRVEYPAGHLAKLGLQLDYISASEKLTIIGSASALAFSGQGSTVSLLGFLAAFANETNPQIWIRMMRDFTRLRYRFDGDGEISKAIKRLTCNVTGKIAQDLGWEKAEGESHLRGQLRANVLAEGFYCDSPEIGEAARQWNTIYETEPEKFTVDPAMNYLAWGAGAKFAPKDAVPKIISRWQESTSSEVKMDCLNAVSMAQDPDVIQNVILPFCFGTAPEGRVLKPTEMPPLTSALAFYGLSGQLQWEYIKEHWEAIRAKMGTPEAISRLLHTALPALDDAAGLEDLDSFFADKDTNGYATALAMAKDGIMNLDRFRKRERASLAAWLKEQGYMESSK